MVRVIGLTQFVFLALCTMALMVLHKADAGRSVEYVELKTFLIQKGYWMVLIPIVYVIVGAFVQKATPSESALKVVQGCGVAIAVAILAVYGWLILGF